MVIETAQWVIVGDQPKLGATVPRGAIRPNVAEDVLVPATFTLLRFEPRQQKRKSLYLSKVVEYISVSLIQDALSLEKKILTAMDSPFQMPRQTSPYLGINLICMDFPPSRYLQIVCLFSAEKNRSTSSPLLKLLKSDG